MTIHVVTKNLQAQCLKKRNQQNLNRVQQKLLSISDVLFLLKQKELTCDLLSSMPGYQFLRSESKQ